MRRSRPNRLKQGRLLVGEQDELLLLLEELGGHRHLDAHARRERLPHDRRAVDARRLAAVPRAAMKGEYALDARLDVGEVAAVEHEAVGRVGREDEPVDRDVGKGEGVDEEDLSPAPLGHRLELAPQLVAMIDRLGERVAHALGPTAASKPVPLPVAALDPAALDLERDDPLLGMGEHEVALVVLRAGGVVAKDHARGVEDLPSSERPSRSAANTFPSPCS
jgi:hypothetical protein